MLEQREHLTCCAVECEKCGRSYVFHIHNATQAEVEKRLKAVTNCPFCGGPAKGIEITPEEARRMRTPADASGTPPKLTERQEAKNRRFKEQYGGRSTTGGADDARPDAG